MSSKQPLWLQAVHRVERAVGEPIEKAVRTDTYFDVVAKATRATAKARRTVVGTSTRMLHVLNLPTDSDVRRMREQLTRMERRLNQLSEDVSELDGTPPPPRSRTRR
jgi:hypothetical protein